MTVRDAASSVPVGHATHGRWILLALMCCLSMVTYLDRVNISIAARPIMESYGLSDVQMGKIFSSFILAYGLFQLPGGWLGDRFGPRVVLTVAILWWSAFTALTAGVGDIVPKQIVPVVWSLAATRFLMGAGEAAAWPNFNRTIANWIPMKERALASSLPLAGGGLGAALTPPFIAWLLLRYGWKESFYAAAILGVAAATVWLAVARNGPEEHSWVNSRELEMIRAGSRVSSAGQGRAGTPWRIIFTNTNVWLLFASAATCGYLVYIYMTWFYVYLTEFRHLPRMQGAWYTAGPYVAMAVMTPMGGILGDRATRRFGKTIGRRLVSMLGMFLAAAGVLLGVLVQDVHVAIYALSLGAGAIYFALSSHWAATIDISQRHAGTVSGIMNWGGNVGGMASPILTPLLAQRIGWTAAMEVAALIIFLGGLLWCFVDAAHHLEEAPVTFDGSAAKNAACRTCK